MIQTIDVHNNRLAREGCDRCVCGVKYWENDICVDCGINVATLLRDPEWIRMNRLDSNFGVWSWATMAVVAEAATHEEAENLALTFAVNSGRSTEVIEAF